MQHKSRFHPDPVLPALIDGAPSAGSGKLGGEASAAPVFDLLRELEHRFLCDDSARALQQGVVCVVECGQEDYSLALTVFPELQGFLHGVLFAMKPATFHGAMSELLLVGCEGYLHIERVRKTGGRRNGEGLCEDSFATLTFKSQSKGGSPGP